MISICLPICNEEDNIEPFILDLLNVINIFGLDVEIVIVENNSTDDTRNKCKRIISLLDLMDIPTKIIYPSKKVSYLDAIKIGVKECKGDKIFLSDVDLQYDPLYLAKLLMDKKSSIVSGAKISRKDPPIRIIESKIYHLFVNILFNSNLRDPDSGFKLLDSKAIKFVMASKYLLYSPYTEIMIRALNGKLIVREIPISHSARISGNSKVSNLKILKDVVYTQIVGLVKLWKDLVL